MSDVIPPALSGLLQVAHDEQPWTSERCKQFIETFYAVVEFVYPTNDDVESDVESDVTSDSSTSDEGELPELTDWVSDDDSSDAPERPSNYIRWATIIPQLVSGELPLLTCRKRTSAASTLESKLCRKYPGLVVNLHDDGDGWTTINVTFGAYRGESDAVA